MEFEEGFKSIAIVKDMASLASVDRDVESCCSPLAANRVHTRWSSSELQVCTRIPSGSHTVRIEITRTYNDRSEGFEEKGSRRRMVGGEGDCVAPELSLSPNIAL